MTGVLKLSVSAAALALLLTAGATSSVRAADVVAEPGCMLSGSVMAGYMNDWQSLDDDAADDLEIDTKDLDWNTPFGEGAGLVTCGGFNIQADVAYYAHSADLDSEDIDWDQTNTHIGGALFYRDPASWAGGLQASWISQDIGSKDIDTFRVGLFGEFYLDDLLTLGGSAAYYNKDWPEDLALSSGKDEDGFELALWGRFYATPDLALTVRGDAMFVDFNSVDPTNNEHLDFDYDGYAITGDAEYLVWDQGLSLFAGARYANRTLDQDGIQGELTIEDVQVFAGIKFYFGQDGTLIERQRTGPVDNTSLWHEKLPEFFTSVVLSEISVD